MTGIVDALENVTNADLEAIVARINTVQTELETLKAARHLIEIKLGIKVDRLAAMVAGRKRQAMEARERKAAAESDNGGDPLKPMTMTEIHRDRAEKFLRNHGATSQAGLAKACGIPTGSITAVLKDSRFRFTARGVELTRP